MTEPRLTPGTRLLIIFGTAMLVGMFAGAYLESSPGWAAVFMLSANGVINLLMWEKT